MSDKSGFKASDLPHLGSVGTYSVTTLNPSSAPSAQNHSNARAMRLERYELQSIARMIIGAAGHAEGLEYPFNFHRTAKCIHTVLGNQVGVHTSKKHAKAFYSGLIVCGSVWACPVCTAKIQERRRIEIKIGMEWSYSHSLKAVMMTFTFPHFATDSLSDLLRKQAIALKMLRSGRLWRRFKEKYAYTGLIRSLEVTLGQHGWHPHVHELWFVSPSADADRMYADILEMWTVACKNAGLLEDDKVEAFKLHAVDLHDNASTGDYLAKQDASRRWGADDEMAKGAKKKGKHPFDLLIQSTGVDKAKARRAGAKFLEYIMTMTKLRKRQLYWSPGLKKRVGLQDKTDEEIAEEKRDSADLLGFLTYSQWSTVRSTDNRGQLLNIAERGGWPAILEFLKGLQPKHEGLEMLQSREGARCGSRLAQDFDLSP